MALPTDNFVKKLFKNLVCYNKTLIMLILAIIMTLIGIIDIMWRNDILYFENGKLIKNQEAFDAWAEETANGRN